MNDLLGTYAAASAAAAAIAVGAAATAIFVYRAVERRRWFTVARQDGRIVVDLKVLREEHARQVLEDARTDPQLDAVLADHERLIAERLSEHPGWDNRFRRRLILAAFGSGVLSGATDLGPQPPPPYRGYGYMPFMVAAIVRLADRPVPWFRPVSTPA